MIKKILKNSLYFFMLFIAVLLIAIVLWSNATFGKVTFDKIIFCMNAPLIGADVDGYIISFIIKALVPSLVISILIYILFNYKYEYYFNLNLRAFKWEKNIILFPFRENVRKFVYVIFLIFSVFYILHNFELVKYIKASLTNSSFIEEHYVSIDDVNLTFPEKKRNLIYIFLESMEASYTDIENGGIIEANLIPNLTKLAHENISFSNTSKLGGALYTVGSTYTTGAMVSYQTGVSLKSDLGINNYGGNSLFLPGIKNLGDILKSNGYNQMLMVGSVAEFGNRKQFYRDHGNYKIFDWNYAVSKGIYKEEDYSWWGIKDIDLFNHAKEYLLNLASEDRPFNFHILTSDTHFEDGFLDKRCKANVFDDQYKNVIHCSDKTVTDFINWIKEQDFYDNTTIVVVGDHITMDSDFFNNYDSNYVRTTYNAIINSVTATSNTTNRQFMSYDMLPTVLTSLGITYDGDRIGIGTDLFSGAKTLTEEYGMDYVNNQLLLKSNFYNEKFVYNRR